MLFFRTEYYKNMDIFRSMLQMIIANSNSEYDCACLGKIREDVYLWRLCLWMYAMCSLRRHKSVAKARRILKEEENCMRAEYPQKGPIKVAGNAQAWWQLQIITICICSKQHPVTSSVSFYPNLLHMLHVVVGLACTEQFAITAIWVPFVRIWRINVLINGTVDLLVALNGLSRTDLQP